MLVECFTVIRFDKIGPVVWIHLSENVHHGRLFRFMHVHEKFGPVEHFDVFCFV